MRRLMRTACRYCGVDVPADVDQLLSELVTKYADDANVLHEVEGDHASSEEAYQAAFEALADALEADAQVLAAAKQLGVPAYRLSTHTLYSSVGEDAVEKLAKDAISSVADVREYMLGSVKHVD